MAPIDKARWKVVSPLLDQLLDADPVERGVSLDQIRRGDHLLAGELEALLAQQTAANRGAFLAGSALQAEAGLEGETVGSYTLQSNIGRGGMGSVWLAHRSDGRYEGKAAIKFLNLASMGRGGVERFRREGSILARLAHPHIARLLDAGVASGGQPYLILEYVAGAPIDRWCDARALSVDARVRLFVDVLAAVAHAHDSLIMHRDLKPSNILVTNDGQVKLLDFGIAELLDDAGKPAPPTEPTLPAARAFTPDFASPEQVQMHDVTTATDVYALGVLLYSLLSGRHPTAPSGATPVERLQAIVEAEPARPSVAVLRCAAASSSESSEPEDVAERRATTSRKLARSLKGDLDNIVAKALKKSPAERYATPTEMAEDLRRHLNHEPVGARNASPSYRAALFVKRHRGAVAAAVLVGVALAAGLIGTISQAQRAERQAEHQAERTEQQAAKHSANATARHATTLMPLLRNSCSTTC